MRPAGESVATLLLPKPVADDAADLLERREARADEAQAVVAGRDHALLDGRLVDLLRRAGLDDGADAAAHRQHLVDRHPPVVAGAGALEAADGAVERAVRVLDAERAQ